MSEHYAPKPPRICPTCGSAVADTFDTCPTCGHAMPVAPTSGAAVHTPTQEPVEPRPHPDGAVIIEDRKTYFNFYLPRSLHNSITLMAVLAQFVSLFLGAQILLGGANNVPVLFIAHVLITTALGIWVLEAMDLPSTVVSLVYTAVFFFVSLITFDIAYWYPIVAAVVALVAMVNGNSSWAAYRLAPIPMAELTEAEKRSAGRTKTVCRILAACLAVVLLVMSGFMVNLEIRENKLYEGFSFGQMSGNTYTNDYAGIHFTAPEGWYCMDEEELEEYNTGYETWGIYTLLYADNQADTEIDYAHVAAYLTKHERPAVAEDYFTQLLKYCKEEGSQLTEELESVTLNDITYRVCHSVYTDEFFGTYHEYILIRTLGRYTYELYFYPVNDAPYDQLLDCFIP